MGLLKTYSISTDVTSGAINQSALNGEIDASGFVDVLECLEVDDDDLNIYGASLANETALDTLISEHNTPTFQENKVAKMTAIGAKTAQIIPTSTFVFDGETFPLDEDSREYWNTIKTSKNDITFPIPLGTIYGTTYSLTNTNVASFWGAARDKVFAEIAAHRVLMNSCAIATTQAELDLIIDNR